MDEESRKFIEDAAFDELYRELFERWKPLKSEVGSQNLQEIGRLLVKFQRMEETTHQFIGTLLGVNQKLTDILTKNLSFRSSLWTALNIAAEVNFQPIKDLKLVINKALKAEEIRNQVVHSAWTSGPRRKTTVGKRGIQHMFEFYKDGDLGKLADQIDRIDTAIIALSTNYFLPHHK